MIGNDVIDIVQSRHESDWQRKGLLQKIFTSEEQLLINQALNPEIMLWLLWSMKEAAYKIYNRQTKIRAYIPQQLACALNCKINNHVSGKVYCHGNIYYTKTMINDDSIHTIATTSLANLNTVKEIKKANIIKDQYGIPSLISPRSKMIKEVSISNHGRYEKVVMI